MPGLLDIAKLQRTVNIDGFDVTVRGISAKKIASLIQRFPSIGEIVFPMAPRTGQPDIADPHSLVVTFPDAIAAVIVAGTVKVGDDSDVTEEQISDIPVGYQVDMLLAILDITLPGGLVPFINKLTRLFGEAAPVSSVLPNGAVPQSETSMPNGRASDFPSPSA